MPGRMRGGPTEIAGVQLMQNEAVLEDVNPAWSAYVGSLLFGTLLLLGALAEATVVDSQNDAGAAAVMGIVVFAVIFGYAAYRRYRTHYIVTDSRVIKRTGIVLNSSTEEVGYEMITGVGVDASRFQSLFGNGTVKVATSGGVGTIELAGAPGAQDLANRIRERHPTLGVRGGGPAPGGGPGAAGQPQGRGAPQGQGGRGQPPGGQPQGRRADDPQQGPSQDRGRQGGQPQGRGAHGGRGGEPRDGRAAGQPRRDGRAEGAGQGRDGPSKRERRQQRADDERRRDAGEGSPPRGGDRRERQGREGGRGDRGERRREPDAGRRDAGGRDDAPGRGGAADREAGGDRPRSGRAGGEREPEGPSEAADDGGAESDDDERRRREDDDGPAWDPDDR